MKMKEKAGRMAASTKKAAPTMPMVAMMARPEESPSRPSMRLKALTTPMYHARVSGT